MRITLGMIAENSLRNIQANQTRVDQLQNQITSGSRINKPSDDPIGTAQARSEGGYVGNEEQVQREVAPGVTVAVSVDPTTTFNPLFNALNQLQSGLTANDTSIVQASLGSFDTALDAVSTARAQIGARTNRLDSLQQRQDSGGVHLTGLLSPVKALDNAAAITKF